MPTIQRQKDARMRILPTSCSPSTKSGSLLRTNLNDSFVSTFPRSKPLSPVCPAECTTSGWRSRHGRSVPIPASPAPVSTAPWASRRWARSRYRSLWMPARTSLPKWKRRAIRASLLHPSFVRTEVAPVQSLLFVWMRHQPRHLRLRPPRSQPGAHRACVKGCQRSPGHDVVTLKTEGDYNRLSACIKRNALSLTGWGHSVYPSSSSRAIRQFR